DAHRKSRDGKAQEPAERRGRRGSRQRVDVVRVLEVLEGGALLVELEGVCAQRLGGRRALARRDRTPGERGLGGVRHGVYAGSGASGSSMSGWGCFASSAAISFALSRVTQRILATSWRLSHMSGPLSPSSRNTRTAIPWR